MDDFDAFDVVASKLMLKRGVKLSELHGRVRQIIEAASKDFPPLQIRYCKSGYGSVSSLSSIRWSNSLVTRGLDDWYNYSTAFKSFSEARPDSLATLCALRFVTNSNRHQIRVRDAQLIAPFGRHLMERWPRIAKLVEAYTRNDLGHQMVCIEQIAHNTKRLIKNLAERDKIGKEETHKRLHKRLDAEQRELTVAIQEKRHALLMHMKSQYEAMLQSLGTKFPEEEIEDANPYSDEDLERKDLSFYDAVTHYGEHHNRTCE